MMTADYVEIGSSHFSHFFETSWMACSKTTPTTKEVNQSLHRRGRTMTRNRRQMNASPSSRSASVGDCSDATTSSVQSFTEAKKSCNDDHVTNSVHDHHNDKASKYNSPNNEFSTKDNKSKVDNSLRAPIESINTISLI